jgi:hypothetical protein
MPERTTFRSASVRHTETSCGLISRSKKKTLATGNLKTDLTLRHLDPGTYHNTATRTQGTQ